MDKFKAVWVSHSSIGDFLKCPRCYYLHNVYKRPETGRKINIVSPALSLGTAVHEVLEGLAEYKAEERFKKSLIPDFEKAWKKVSGKKGGFLNGEEEVEAKKRARAMIERVEKNPGLLLEKTVKLPEIPGEIIPNFYLSKEEKIILCGKVDWLVHKPEDDSVRILDFKTGKNDEDGESLQLPIYELLLKNLQKRKISGASYWYLERDDMPVDMPLPDTDLSFEKVFSIAKKIKDARARLENENPEDVFICPRGEEGCFACRSFEKIVRGEAEYVGTGEMRQDLFIV